MYRPIALGKTTVFCCLPPENELGYTTHKLTSESERHTISVDVVMPLLRLDYAFMLKHHSTKDRMQPMLVRQ